MHMLSPGLHLVKVLFPFQMHEIQLIHQPEFFQKFNGSVDGGPVDVWPPLPCLFEQRDSIQVLLRSLNDFDQRAPLRRHPDPLRGQLIHKRAAFRREAHRNTPIFATESQLRISDC